MDCPVVLIVEDDPLVLEFFLKALAGRGFAVVAASELVSAARLVECTTGIAVVLMDLFVPGGSTLALARKLRQKRIKVVFATGFPEPQLPLDLAETRLLRKPFGIEALVDAVVQHLPARGTVPA